jgi:hypothetical protein
VSDILSPHFAMTDIRRLLQAAAALSRYLSNSGVAHAFHGSVLTALLANSSQSDVGDKF